MEYKYFLNIFLNLLNKNTPMTQKYLRAKILSDRTKMSRNEDKKQRKFCVNLLKKNRKEHFTNLDVNSMSDNKIFWQIVKPFSQIKLKLKQISN